MKRLTKTMVAVGITLGLFGLVAPVVISEPVQAAACTCNSSGKTGVQVSTLGEPGTDANGNAVNCSCDDGTGSSVFNVLDLVVNIMTVGVGVLAAIGLTVSGIQYLTAGGNEERTRKSKRRIFEIIIGLAVYVAIYAILQWLVPGA